MIKRIVMLALVCVLLMGAKTSGKSYLFNVKDPAYVGTVQLKAGGYRLKVDGAQVVLTDKDGRVIDAPAQLETCEQKFEQTAVLSRESGESRRITSIQLGGTSYTVVFD